MIQHGSLSPHTPVGPLDLLSLRAQRTTGILVPRIRLPFPRLANEPSRLDLLPRGLSEPHLSCPPLLLAHKA